MDHDNGSSEYEDYSNVVYKGGFKIAGGVHKNVTGNLLVEAVPWFQNAGFDTDIFVDNTVVSSARQTMCGPKNMVAFRGTTYASLIGAQEKPPTCSQGGGHCCRGPGWGGGRIQCENGDWSHAFCDDGANITMSPSQLLQMLRDTVQASKDESHATDVLV